MKYKKYNDTYAVRLEVGDEIVSSVLELAEKENIGFAEVSAIGAVNKATVGLYNLTEKQYHKRTFNEPLEITSLLGNITRKDKKPYVHLHANFANEDCLVFGGHLNEAYISATCEMFVRCLDGEMGRLVCEKTGLNIYDI